MLLFYFLDLSTSTIAGTVDNMKQTEDNSLITTFAQKKDKRSQPQSKKKNKCSYCDKTFCRPSHLVYHICMHTGERPYVCQICRKTFTVFSSLKLHKKIHGDIKPFQCTDCDYTTITMSNLKRHRLRHH